MRHITDEFITLDKPSAITLGNFDGLHMGHRRLIELTKEWAAKENLQSVLYSFNPHPMFLFNHKEHSALILTREEKYRAIEKTGIDLYVEQVFTREFAATSPEGFMDYFFGNLNPKVVVVGENFTFGNRGMGTVDLLQKRGEELGIRVISVPIINIDGERVCSTRIRSCLLDRDVETANKLLLEPYFTQGTVIEGKKLGRTIGFPTINVHADFNKLFPPNGVYATVTYYDGKPYYGVTNVGYNPTVNGQVKVVETFLFDFDKMIYGENVKTNFYKWIRDERKFGSIDELVAQMTKDTQTAKDYFASPDFDVWRDKI
ncbi:MAG: bifunctional riboflavin kinase/FAD synthetase [Firmicutes bacterium]|nr:bifunctional riboflavin kinase/FAD synthetase [Bacillota bacterium]